MNNQNSKHDGVAATMDKIADAAPFITFVIACLSFTLIIVFKTDYYTAVFSERWHWWAALAAGILAGLATEGSRAILLVLTFRDFRNGNSIGGFLGLILSFGLVGYDCFSAGPVSALWTGSHAVTMGPVIRDIVVFLVVLSAGLELRLALSTQRKKEETPQEDDEDISATPAATKQATPVQPVAQQPRATVQQPPQRPTHNGNGTMISNSTNSNTQRQRIGFFGGVAPDPAQGRNAVANSIAATQPAPAATFRNDGVLLSEQLETARGNLRAYRSKLRSGKGNTETLQRGVAKWETMVADLEAQLQTATA